MSRVAGLCPVAENSPLKKREKGMSAFFVKHSFLWLSRSKALLVGRRNDKTQRRSETGKGKRKKGYNIQVWGPHCANCWTICGEASEAEKKLNLCTQPETINGQES